MKIYDVKNNGISDGIFVASEPYPHVVIGDGGNKRATWIALGKRDINQIVMNKGTSSPEIKNVGIIALKDADQKPTGKYLIVAPRGHDDRVLVLWRVSSGYRGSADITAGEGVMVIAQDKAWHSGRGSLGEDAEMLAILKPGQELTATRSGRDLEQTRAKLVYDGKAIIATLGDENLEAATADKAEGDYI